MSREDPLGDGTDASPGEGTAGPDDRTDAPERSHDDLVVELERLRERNRQLRATYERARTAQYRRTAIGLAALGVVGVASAALVPSLRDVLLVLGATGLFGGLLTFYLTPEQFIAADVSQSVYDTMAGDRTELVADLGLADERVYVPVGESGDRVRLFVPQYEDYELPDGDALADSLVVPAEKGGRGATFTPTGTPLYESLLESLPGDPAERPGPLAEQVSDALVEQFELLDNARIDDSEAGRLTVGIGETVYGPADRFDNPVASLYAVALARVLDEAVSVDIDTVTDGRDNFLLTYRWGDDHDSTQ
ncbi:hypothetical protein [Halosimplex pelagicum]|uniref:DUF7982 domain-containing protein n=1 Tax=Halosimplex pelagicum TaxID=869886 RepID=A0A7D5T478_9EURY|nr:hypothetical protein [Halosimplex pelagicum]QLH81348.1 hypothetical protein HZS54_06790 [Halosimplex pelagicum]